MNDDIILQSPTTIIDRSKVRRRFSRIGFALLAMVALHQLSSIALTLVIEQIPALAELAWLQVMVIFLPLYLISLPAMLLILRKIKPLPFAGEKRRVSPAVIAGLSAACYASMVAINLLGLGLYSLLEMVTGREAVNPLESIILESNPIVIFLFVVVGAPLIEEYIFRGLLLKYIGGFGARTYILFSALTFALFHANLVQVMYALLMGLVFAALTYYSGTILYAVIAHMAVNFLGSGVPIIMQRFGETGEMLLGFIVIAVVGLGVISGVMMFLRRKKLQFEPATVETPRGAVYQNPGVIAFIAALSALTIFVLAM